MSLVDLTGDTSYRATRGRVPVFRTLLNGQEFDITVLEAQFQLTSGAHDAASLSCASGTLKNLDGLIGSCMSFFYGQAPRTEAFNGYIMQADVDQAGQGNLSFTLGLLGATHPMQSGQPRFWTNHTIPEVVEKLAFQSGLGFFGHTHDFVWKSLAQTQETDWRSALELVARLGWVLFNRYGVLLCYDPKVLFQESGAYATLMSSQNRDFDATADRRLIEFNPQQQSTVLPENLGRQIAYFTDSGDIQVTKEIGSFSKYKFVTDFVIRSYEEAQVYANAGARRIEQWNQHAEARIWGDSDIYPGMNVDVITSNPAYYRAQYDGRWLVKSVQHKMDTQQFQTMLYLCRPNNTASITQDAYRPFWQDAGKARPTLGLDTSKTPTTATTDVSHAWVSSWTDPRARSVL